MKKNLKMLVFGSGYSVFFSCHVLLFCGRCTGDGKGGLSGVYVVSGWFVCSDAGVLPAAACITFFISEKNLMTRENDPELW